MRPFDPQLRTVSTIRVIWSAATRRRFPLAKEKR